MYWLLAANIGKPHHPGANRGGNYRAGTKPVAIMSTLSLDFASARLVRAPQGPVRAGVIGCGVFGAGILAQAASVPLLEIPAVADRRLDAARRAYEGAGVPEDAIVRCDSRRAALRAIEAGK